MGSLRGHKAQAIIVFAILFLFFLQQLTDLVAGIYSFGLMNPELPPEIALMVLFLTPFLLLLFKRGVPTTVLIILGEVVLLGRAVEIVLSIRYQIIVTAVGVGAFLFLFPALLFDRAQKKDKATGLLMATGLLLAIASSILLRTLGGTMDLTNVGMFKGGAWLLAIIAGVLIPGVFRTGPEAAEAGETTTSKAGWGRSIIFAIGILSVFLLLYAGFTSPTVISRWTNQNYLVIMGVTCLALVLFGWILVVGATISFKFSRVDTLIQTALFGLALSLTLAVHQVAMPAEPGGFPLLDPKVGPGWIASTLVMLLLFPVVFSNFGLLVDGIVLGRPSIRQLGLGFGLASLLMLLLILLIVFTSTWSYIALALEPIVRNRFWQLHMVVAILLTLSLLAVPIKGIRNVRAAMPVGPIQAVAILVTVFGVVAFLSAVLLSPDPSQAAAKQTLTVAGYNLRQGYNLAGERGHEEQCKELKEIDADIIALSETDTSRIAGGNFDVVRFMAQCLDMNVYTGPKTGAGTFGYALLSKYSIVEPQTYHLFSGPNLPSSSRPGDTSGGDQVAVVKARVDVGNQSFTVFANHFDSRPPYEQPEGFASLAGAVDGHIIAIGDYNCRPRSECIDIITAVLDHCDRAQAEAGDHIDHIFVSSGLSCPNYGYIDSDASDHPVVVSEITW
jgi:endonuclease/exonuclease/phosphatase family metal-dependent hydrolase